jgi:hypothetical protein
MDEGPIIRARDLLATWNTLPPEMQNDSQMAVLIIKAFLGMPWLNIHVREDTKTPGLLTIKGTTGEQNLARVRLVDLAESLFNLCRIRGFGDCIERMKTAKNPEPSLAELHIGKMLYANDWPFRFVVPQGKRGDNYDLEIRYHGQVVCADVKCTIASQAPDSKTITNTLAQSRTQLPDTRPGVFFVKIPQRWMEYPGWQSTAVKGAIDFFERGTGRIVSVSFYVEPIHLIGERAQQGHHFYEIANRRRRFGKNLDWRFFQRWLPANAGRPNVGSWNAMPAKYIRLFQFPRGLIGQALE